MDSSDEATAGPVVNPEEQELVRRKILDSQYKCFEKMNRHPAYNKTGRCHTCTSASPLPRSPPLPR